MPLQSSTYSLLLLILSVARRRVANSPLYEQRFPFIHRGIRSEIIIKNKMVYSQENCV